MARNVWMVACTLGLGLGCVVGPAYEPPKMLAPAAYKELADGGAGWNAANPTDALKRGAWWSIYQEPQLDALEREAGQNNQNIRQFYENYMAARAQIGEAWAQYFPTVSVGLGYTWSRTSSTIVRSGSLTGPGGATTQPLTGSAAGPLSIFSIPIEASWTPDLWGRVRSLVHGAQYSAQESAALLENERLVQQASLAQAYFSLRGQDALRQVLTETIAADAKSLEYTRAQFQTGVGTEISVVQAENTLATARATAQNLEVARAQYEHAIATLVGKPASEFSIPYGADLPNAPAVPVGLPSTLLERRPDIAAAERLMAAANAQIGVGEAAYYPNLTLSLSGGLESSNLGNLFELPSRFWSMGPSVSETVFDAGLRRSTVRQYIAQYNANLAAYRQAVLTAFQQVEDGLSTTRTLAQQVAFNRSAVESAQRALTMEEGRYQTGIDPYIDVVISQNAVLSARQALVLVQVQQLTASVQLIQALGGGWERSQLPSVDQVSETPAESDTKIQK